MVKTKSNGEIVKKSNGDSPFNKMITLVRNMEPEIKRALPRHVTADRISRIVMTAIRINPKLAECTPASFLGAVMQASQLGLEVNTPLGHAYLVPFFSRKNGLECTLIIGYQGMIDLAMRSGRVSSIYAHVVREGDEFSYNLGLYPDLTHVPSDDHDREDRPITHVYAVARMKDGEPMFRVLSAAQVAKRRARSQTADKGFSPWKTDEEAMVLKTAVRALYAWMPKSTEFTSAIAIEDTTERAESPLPAFGAEVTQVLEESGLVSDIIDEQTGELFPGETSEPREPGCDDAGLGE